jgi:hypothetical protein
MTIMVKMKVGTVLAMRKESTLRIGRETNETNFHLLINNKPANPYLTSRRHYLKKHTYYNMTAST